MNGKNSPISCDVCLDLIPLVLDHVASEDSVALVKCHVAECPSCRHALGNEAQFLPPPAPNDTRVLHTVRKSVFISALSVLILGALFGIALSNSANMFYNFIIMPMVGALSYYLFRKRWYLPCLGVSLITYVWILIQSIIEEGFDGYVFYLPFYMTIIYLLLTSLGVLIAFLLHYAFRKEDSGNFE